MSLEFVKLASELNAEKYSVQLQSVIAKKIPCALFYGFALPQDKSVLEMITNLKNMGFNLKSLYVIDEEQKKSLKMFTPPPLVKCLHFLNCLMKISG